MPNDCCAKRLKPCTKPNGQVKIAISFLIPHNILEFKSSRYAYSMKRSKICGKHNANANQALENSNSLTLEFAFKCGKEVFVSCQLKC